MNNGRFGFIKPEYLRPRCTHAPVLVDEPCYEWPLADAAPAKVYPPLAGDDLMLRLLIGTAARELPCSTGYGKFAILCPRCGKDGWTI